MDRYEKHIVDNLTEAAKVALGTFNAYRRNLRFFPDRSVDSAYVAELRVYKQGFPHTREYDLPVNFPKSNNTNGY
jgi:DNA/RNA endonuclease G (NUC1)